MKNFNFIRFLKILQLVGHSKRFVSQQTDYGFDLTSFIEKCLKSCPVILIMMKEKTWLRLADYTPQFL